MNIRYLLIIIGVLIVVFIINRFVIPDPVLSRYNPDGSTISIDFNNYEESYFWFLKRLYLHNNLFTNKILTNLLPSYNNIDSNSDSNSNGNNNSNNNNTK